METQRKFITHILGLVVQTGSALVSFFAFMGTWYVFSWQIEDIAELGFTEETGFPLLGGAVILSIGSPLYYLIAFALFKWLGKSGIIERRHSAVFGCVHGLVLWPSIILLPDIPALVLPDLDDGMAELLLSSMVMGLASAAVAAFIVSVYLLLHRPKHAAQGHA